MGLFTRRRVVREVPNPYGIGTATADEAGNLVGVLELGSYGLDGNCETEVVGESFYRATLLEYVEDAIESGIDGVDVGRVEALFTLHPEPNNPHDANAVGVRFEGGRQVGHLPRHIAAGWSPVLRGLLAGGVTSLECFGVVVWPAHRGDPRRDESIPVGVMLDVLSTPVRG